MPITALFNLGSLILGLAAWILPVISLAHRAKNGKKHVRHLFIRKLYRLRLFAVSADF